MVTSVSSTFEVSLTPELQSLLAEEVARTGSPPNRVVGDALLDWLRRRQRRRRVDAEIAAYATEHAGTEFDLDPQLEEAGRVAGAGPTGSPGGGKLGVIRLRTSGRVAGSGGFAEGPESST